MTEYMYRCEKCGEEIPALQVDNIEGFRHHTVGEKHPEPCGPVREITVIKNFPMNFPKGLAVDAATDAG